MSSPLLPSPSAILIADAHVKPGTPSEEHFFQMLDWLEKAPFPDIVFLGDILELWIGIPAYGNDLQRKFLEWCRRVKRQPGRRIFFLEGNHEYFVLAHHAECFTDSACDELRIPSSAGTLLLTHGDYQLAEVAHLRFRWWCKSRLAHLLLKYLPFAPAYVRHLKRKLEKKSLARLHRFPGEELTRWAKNLFEAPDAPWAILMGHFHKGFQATHKDGRLLAVLPAWKDRGEVGVYNFSENRLFFRNWRSLQSAQNPH